MKTFRPDGLLLRRKFRYPVNHAGLQGSVFRSLPRLGAAPHRRKTIPTQPTYALSLPCPVSYPDARQSRLPFPPPSAPRTSLAEDLPAENFAQPRDNLRRYEGMTSQVRKLS